VTVRSLSPARLVACLLLGSAAALSAADPETKGAAGNPPHPGKEPVELRLPPALRFNEAAGPDAVVLFRHETHFELVGERCTACHPRPFSILHATRKAPHVETDAGRSCGICHDGRQAFATSDQDSCARCHEPSAAGSAPARALSTASPQRIPAERHEVPAAPAASATPTAPTAAQAPSAPAREIVLPRSDASPGTVTFRHATHAPPKARCPDCHPGLFARRAGGTAFADHSVFHTGKCGSCHDGKKAFAVDDGDRCGACHAPGGTGS